MSELKENWLTDGLIDFEYKKYLLLAYLQDVAAKFDERKLYPRLSELIQHYRQLQLFSEKKELMQQAFPKEISQLDFEKMRLEFTGTVQDDELMRELEDIVQFALPQIENRLGVGRELYEQVEHHMEFFPVGIEPLRKEEGYFFLSDFRQRLVSVYYYAIRLFENTSSTFRGLHTRLLFEYNLSISQHYQQVKYNLIEQNKELPNPATYAIEFRESFPRQETLLPVAQRKLLRTLSGNLA